MKKRRRDVPRWNFRRKELRKQREIIEIPARAAKAQDRMEKLCVAAYCLCQSRGTTKQLSGAEGILF